MEPRRHARDRRAQVGGQQRLALEPGQGREPDRRVRRPGGGEGPGLGPRPARHDQHERLVGETIDHHLEELHRGRIGPLEVLDGEHQRALLEPPLDQATHRQEDLPLELLGLDVAEAVGGLHAKHVSEERGDRGRLLTSTAQRREAGGELLPSELERIIGSHAVRLAEEGGKDRVRLLAEGGADGVTHGHGREPPARLERREPLLEQARLAHTGLAGQTHHPRRALEHLLEGGDHLRELGRPADHGSTEPQHPEPPPGAADRARPRKPERRERLALALHRELARRRQAECVLCELPRGRAHQGLAGRCGALEP